MRKQTQFYSLKPNASVLGEYTKIFHVLSKDSRHLLKQTSARDTHTSYVSRNLSSFRRGDWSVVGHVTWFAKGVCSLDKDVHTVHQDINYTKLVACFMEGFFYNQND